MSNVITHPYAYEAFSLSHAEANGRDLFGVRFYKISKNPRIPDVTYIEINTGYMLKTEPEDGPVELHLPSKDETGNVVATLIIRVAKVEHWRLILSGEPGPKTGHEFTYRGEITWNSGTITLELPDKSRKVLTDKVVFEPGRDQRLDGRWLRM